MWWNFEIRHSANLSEPELTELGEGHMAFKTIFIFVLWNYMYEGRNQWPWKSDC